MTHNILYIYPQSAIIEPLKIYLEVFAPGYKGYLYAKEARNSFNYDGSSIQLIVIQDILKKIGSTLDLILVDGLVNNRLALPSHVREWNSTNAKIVVAPHFSTYNNNYDDSKDVAESGADFGLDFPMASEDVIEALDDMLAGRVGKYILNPNLYMVIQGFVVPK